jgi:macrodomain Ter protein organizer (MatP/YcbG family)
VLEKDDGADRVTEAFDVLNQDMQEWFSHMLLSVLRPRLSPKLINFFSSHLNDLSAPTSNTTIKKKHRSNNDIKRLEKYLIEQNKADRLSTQEEVQKYVSKHLKSQTPHTLVHMLNDKSVDSFIDLIKSQAKADRVPLYCIDDLGKLDGHHAYIELKDQRDSNILPGEIKAPPGGALHRFIKRHKNGSSSPILLLDARKIKHPSHYTSVLNSELGNRNINGIQVPRNVRIITLVDSGMAGQRCLDDKSFTSRHHVKEKIWVLRETMPSPIRSDSNEPDLKNDQTIDLCYSPNFKRILLGGCNYNQKGEVIFEKGPLIQAIGKGYTNFTIDHPPEDLTQFETWLQDIQITGRIQYLNCSVDCPKNIQFKFKHTPLEEIALSCDCLQSIETKTIEAADAAGIDHWLTPTTFEYLFYNKTVQSHKLHVHSGWIQEATNKTLKLYINRTLNRSHYHRLFSACKQHKVKVHLYLSLLIARRREEYPRKYYVPFKAGAR